MIYNKEINCIGYTPERGYNEYEREVIYDYITNMKLVNEIIIDSTGNDLIDFVKFAGYDDIFHFLYSFNAVPEKVIKEINEYIISHVET